MTEIDFDSFIHFCTDKVSQAFAFSPLFHNNKNNNVIVTSYIYIMILQKLASTKGSCSTCCCRPSAGHCKAIVKE